MEWWRWKSSDFQAQRAVRGKPLPDGVKPCVSLHGDVLGDVTVNGMRTEVRDGWWVRYIGEGESRRIVAVMSDARIREQAVCLED